MSLSKDLCLRSDTQNSHSFSDCFLDKFESKKDNYRRDSFSDCFCDDLSEVLLQFLSLEDKLRLQCVSKQFQRTVFRRQYELYINMSPDAHKRYLENKYLGFRFYHNYYYIEDQSLDSYKNLLKKCPNITSIEFKTSYRDYNIEKVNEVFQLIIENCDNLSEIIVENDIKLNKINLKEFHRKFGTKIKRLRYLRTFRKHIRLNLFPKIQKIKISYLDVNYKSIIPQMKLDKLKQLEIAIPQGKEHMLETVIDKFPKLTHFKILFTSEDENAIYESSKNISNLKHLIHFKFFHFVINNNFSANKRFYNLLQQMAKNCQNLKSIECHFVFNDENLDIKQFLFQLKAFPLKRLNLWLICINNKIEDSIDVNQLFSFELFKGFENITHLSLRLSRFSLNESILQEIDINFPKLQYLEIDYPFDTTPEGVTQMAEIVSRLSRLETLKLWFKSGVDFKPIEEQITEKCRKIRTIEIKIPNF